jgi:putative flippase GtrA
MRFFVVSLASLGANLVLLELLVTAGTSKFVGQAIAIVLVTPLNFIGNKLWSFRRHKK